MAGRKAWPAMQSPQADRLASKDVRVASNHGTPGGAEMGDFVGGLGGAPAGQQGVKEMASPGQRNVLENSINLDMLMQLRQAFKDADADGGGNLDMEEFVEAFRGVLQLSREKLRQLFMKVDANSDGTIDWDEFSTFMLLENQGTAKMDRSKGATTLFVEQDWPDPNLESAHHKDMITRIFYLSSSDRYGTAGRDGTIRLWNARDLSLQKVIRNGRSWVTDAAPLSATGGFAAASFNRVIQIYDLSTFEVVGTLSDLEHVPMSMSPWNPDKKSSNDFLLFGDDGGFVQLCSVDPMEEVVESKSSERWKINVVWRNPTHTDWVSKVQAIPELNAVASCSLDTTVCLTDFERRGAARTLAGHTKGVYSFAWSQAYKFIASCGMDRHVLLWNPYSAKPMATLAGHKSSVQDVLVSEEENQIITLGVDKVIKVWDIRNHKCLQTFVDKACYRPENRISAMLYDPNKAWLVTGTTHLRVWPLRSRQNDAEGLVHKDPLAGALYNQNFDQVVSGDHGGMVCVWEVTNGALCFRFGNAHGNAKITAMAFDTHGRRLLTGSHAGDIKMWNFSIGSCLKTLKSKSSSEVAGIMYVKGGYHSKHIITVGWDQKVSFWEDGPHHKVQAPTRTLSGHTDDILSIALELPSTLATSSYDGTVILWNIDSGAIKHKLQPKGLDALEIDKRAVEKVEFMAGRPHTLACCGADGYLRLWNCSSGQLLLEVDLMHKRGESVQSMCSSKSAHYLVTGDSDGCIKVWDMSALTTRGQQGKSFVGLMPGQGGLTGAGSSTPTNCMLRELVYWRAHQSTVVSVELVPGRDVVLTASTDCNVSLWSLEGAHIGDFGRDSWDLSNTATWRSLTPEPVLPDKPAEAGADGGNAGGGKEGEDAPSASAPQEARTTPTPSLPELRGSASTLCLQSEDVAQRGPDQDEEEEDEETGPVARAIAKQTWIERRSIQQARKLAQTDYGSRVYMPEGSSHINYPKTLGRPTTSIAHLLHIHKLKDVNEAPRGQVVLDTRTKRMMASSRAPALDTRTRTAPTGASRPNYTSGQSAWNASAEDGALTRPATSSSSILSPGKNPRHTKPSQIAPRRTVW
eukprot:jgi/Mesvir1/22351/Mv03617-RA.1